MKVAIILLFVFCYADCRKTYAPIDKNANIDFINMEAGGVQPAKPRPGTAQLPAGPAKPPSPIPQPTKPPTPVKPHVEAAKPAVPATPAPQPKPHPTQPTQIRPKPVNPAPVANPITTPGPGSVKSLVNFYDSQGKASPIRPYSYSQAVKQG